MSETIAVDIETNGLLQDVTKLHQISIVERTTREVTSYNENGGRPFKEAFARMRKAKHVVGHNFLAYDLLALGVTSGDIGVPWTKIIDTIVLSRLGNPERLGGHSLFAWGNNLGGQAKVEHEDWTQWSPDMERRCNVDAELTMDVFERLEPMLELYPEAVAMEHECAWITGRMCQRGYALDRDHAIRVADGLLADREVAANELLGIFPPILVPVKPSKPVKRLSMVNRNHALYGKLDAGVDYCPLKIQEFNPGSREQVGIRFKRKYGWKPKKLTDTGLPKIDEEILAELPFSEAPFVAKYLKIEKLLSQIQGPIKKNGRGGGWLPHARQQPDGHYRVHSSVIPLACVSSRMSSSGPNVQQVATEDFMRRAWIAKPGYVLVGVDADGLEGRNLGHYLKPYDKGKFIEMLLKGTKKDGTDLHSTNQRSVGLYSRDGAKPVFYGFLYGAGGAKLGSLVLKDAHAAGKPVNLAHLGFKGKKASITKIGDAAKKKLLQGIDGLYDLTSALSAKSKEKKFIKGLDGRKLWSRSPHSALNLALQSAGAILMKWAVIFAERALAESDLVEDEDYGLVMQVHDELIYEVKPEHAERVMGIVNKAIADAGVHLKFRIEHVGTGKIGHNWYDVH